MTISLQIQVFLISNIHGKEISRLNEFLIEIDFGWGWVALYKWQLVNRKAIELEWLMMNPTNEWRVIEEICGGFLN